MRRPGAATCPPRTPHLPQCRRRRVMVYVTPCRPHTYARVIHSPTRPPARHARKLLRRQRPPSRGQIPSLYGTKPLLRRAGGGGGQRRTGGRGRWKTAGGRGRKRQRPGRLAVPGLAVEVWADINWLGCRGVGGWVGEGRSRLSIVAGGK